MARKAHRFATGLAGGCAILLGISLASCGAPSFTYIADSRNSTYFKVPFGWQQVNSTDLCAVLKAGTGRCPSGWLIAYEGDGRPSAQDYPSPTLAVPFVFAGVEPYQSQTGTPPTDDTLRDFYLPVTAAARASFEMQNGVSIAGFKQLRDKTLTLSNGVHGVRETFVYRFSLASDTFDEVVLANAAGTTIYFLIVHCMTSCYSQDKTAIDEVMSSFTVRSF